MSTNFITYLNFYFIFCIFFFLLLLLFNFVCFSRCVVAFPPALLRVLFKYVFFPSLFMLLLLLLLYLVLTLTGKKCAAAFVIIIIVVVVVAVVGRCAFVYFLKKFLFLRLGSTFLPATCRIC